MKPKVGLASLHAAAVTVLFVTLVTVVADLQPPLKDWLKNTFSHHWVGKGWLSAGLFVLLTLWLSFMPTQVDGMKIRKAAWTAFWSALAGTVVLFGFFLYEAFWKG